MLFGIRVHKAVPDKCYTQRPILQMKGLFCTVARIFNWFYFPTLPNVAFFYHIFFGGCLLDEYFDPDIWARVKSPGLVVKNRGLLHTIPFKEKSSIFGDTFFTPMKCSTSVPRAVNAKSWTIFFSLITIDPSKVEQDQMFVCTLFDESLQESAPFVAGLFCEKKDTHPTPLI